MPAQIVIADLNIGNVGSIQNMLASAGIESTIRSSPENLSDGTVVVLSGVGSFDAGIRNLKSSGWFEALAGASNMTPVMGICLGMQLLGLRSEEGQQVGLSRVPFSFHALRPDGTSNSDFRLPHMGWNSVQWSKTHSTLASDDPYERFYFVHSYASSDLHVPGVASTSFYGTTFVSSIWTDKTVGFQFHPEKSHTYGRRLIAAAIQHLGKN